jgi:hypothetical protein
LARNKIGGGSSKRKRGGKSSSSCFWKKVKADGLVTSVYHALDGCDYRGQAARDQSARDKEALGRRKAFHDLGRTAHHRLPKGLPCAPLLQRVPGSADASDLDAWSLPDEIKAAYRRGGVQKLYQWQAECLGKVLDAEEEEAAAAAAAAASASAAPGAYRHSRPAPKNVAYCAPTSGGKTLVAEILMVRCLMAGVCVYVLSRYI